MILINLKLGHQGYKTFFILNSAEHEIILLINVKMPTIVGILTVISRIKAASESIKARKMCIFHNFSFYELLKFYAWLSLACKKFYNLGARILNFYP